MADLEPGTTEYQQAYDEEMARLEAGDDKPHVNAADAEPITNEATEASGDADKTEAEKPSVEDELKALKDALAKQEKIAKDNHAAFTRKAQEFAKLQRKLEKEERERLRPELLDSVPGLEEAIRYTTPARNEEPWVDTVSRALPDIDSMLADPVFAQRVGAIKDSLGEDWQDPLVAIRELSNARAEYKQEQVVSQVREQARKDFQDRSKKLSAMGVPSGSGKVQAKTEDDGSKYKTMTSEEFAKERAKVLGY